MEELFHLGDIDEILFIWSNSDDIINNSVIFLIFLKLGSWINLYTIYCPLECVFYIMLMLSNINKISAIGINEHWILTLHFVNFL